MYEIVVTYPLASHGDMRSCHVVNVLHMVISHHKSAWWILMRGSSHESLVERFFPLHLVRCVFSSLLSNKVAGGRGGTKNRSCQCNCSETTGDK